MIIEVLKPYLRIVLRLDVYNGYGLVFAGPIIVGLN